MAELALRIGDGSGYEDGDILCAFNDRQILWANGELIFWPRIDGDPDKPRVGGFLGNGQYSLLHSVLGKTSQYKFERVSQNEVVRTDLWGHERVVYSPYSHKLEWRMDVRKYIERRKSGGRKPIFGRDGREIWYGGKNDYSHDNALRVWDDIEYYTDHVRDNHILWPTGGVDLRHFLFISTQEDFDDTLAGDLVSPIFSDICDTHNDIINVDENTVKTCVCKRKNKIQWRDLPGFSSPTRDIVPQREVDIDIRQAVKFQVFDIVQNKER